MTELEGNPEASDGAEFSSRRDVSAAVADVLVSSMSSLMWTLIFVPLALPLAFAWGVALPHGDGTIEDPSFFIAAGAGLATAGALGGAYGVRRWLVKSGRPRAVVSAVALLGAYIALGAWVGVMSDGGHWPDASIAVVGWVVFPFGVRSAVLVADALWPYVLGTLHKQREP